MTWTHMLSWLIPLAGLFVVVPGVVWGVREIVRSRKRTSRAMGMVLGYNAQLVWKLEPQVAYPCVEFVDQNGARREFQSKWGRVGTTGRAARR